MGTARELEDYYGMRKGARSLGHELSLILCLPQERRLITTCSGTWFGFCFLLSLWPWVPPSLLLPYPQLNYFSEDGLEL